MTKEQFDDLFVRAKQRISPKSEDEIVERISQYAKDVSKINIYELTTYIQLESIKYTNDLVYILLSEIAVDK